MTGTFKFELVSPERILISGDAEQVQLSGAEGDMTILPGHAPVISTLRPGMLEIEIAGSKSRMFVKSGFAEVEPDRVTVLAEKAFNMAEFDAGRIADELKIAETELADAKDDASKAFAERAVEQLRLLSSKAA